MPSDSLTKEDKLDAANKAREEVKRLLSIAQDGAVDGVRRRVCAHKLTQMCCPFDLEHKIDGQP